MVGVQVLLLPNFAVCVTREMRPVDGFDTIDLLEQARTPLAPTDPVPASARPIPLAAPPAFRAC